MTDEPNPLTNRPWPPEVWDAPVPDRSDVHPSDAAVRETIERWGEKREALARFAMQESNTGLHDRVAVCESYIVEEFLPLYRAFRFEPVVGPFTGIAQQLDSTLREFRNYLADAGSAMEKEQFSQFFDSLQQAATAITQAADALRPHQHLFIRKSLDEAMSQRFTEFAGADPDAAHRAMQTVLTAADEAAEASRSVEQADERVRELLTTLEQRLAAVESDTRKASAESLGSFFASEADDAVTQRRIWMVGLAAAIGGAIATAFLFDDLPTDWLDALKDHRVPLQLVLIVGWFVVLRTCSHEVTRSGTLRADARRRAAALRTYSQMERLAPDDARTLLPAVAEHVFRGAESNDGGSTAVESAMLGELLALSRRQGTTP
ncbi:MAG: hypothetical protein KDC46_09905 [Thermoleophilia bacterium]|nr:hypothetical protein [Thermoleophilia bacterium]